MKFLSVMLFIAAIGCYLCVVYAVDLKFTEWEARNDVKKDDTLNWAMAWMWPITLPIYLYCTWGAPRRPVVSNPYAGQTIATTYHFNPHTGYYSSAVYDLEKGTVRRFDQWGAE
jgi:hypothetical protein